MRFLPHFLLIMAVGCSDDDRSPGDEGEPGSECASADVCEQPESSCRVATCNDGVCGSDFAPAGTSCDDGGVCDAAGNCALGTPAWTMHYGFIEGWVATSEERIVYYGTLLGDHDFVGTSLTAQGNSDGFIAHITREGQQESIVTTANPAYDALHDAVMVEDGVVTVETRTSEVESRIQILKRGFDGQAVMLGELMSGPYENFAFSSLRIVVSSGGDIALVGLLPDDPLLLNGTPITGNAFDPFAVVMDASGNERWRHVFADAGALGSEIDAVFDETALVIATRLDGSVQIGDLSLSIPEGERGAFVAALDASGTPIWASTVIDNTHYGPLRLAANPSDGGVALAGTFETALRVNDDTVLTTTGSRTFVLRIASNGSRMWSHAGEQPGPFIFSDVAFDRAGNVALCATEEQNTDPDPNAITPWHHLHLTKLAAGGEVLWQQRFGSDVPGVSNSSNPGASCNGIAVSGDLIVVTGTIVGDIALGSPVTATSSSGALNAFIAAFSP